jgi:dipeptidyl aminopeptidase/acylaminoacyl peptidase
LSSRRSGAGTFRAASRRRAKAIRWCLAALWLAACHYFPDHFLGHPHDPAPGVETWSEPFALDPLRIHVRVARPPGGGPFAAVIVHPEGGKTADDMQGVLWDLSARGYFAIAADYERWIDGAYRRNMFAWRSDADASAILDVALGYPEVDPARIGLLGFSQGAVYSLLIAAHAPDRVRAVVAYYPVTDFPTFLKQPRIAWSPVGWWFRRESGAKTDDEYERMLHAASPYYVADAIKAPVLLIHGDRDTTAPLTQSERMAERLRALHKPVQLLVVPGGRHIFNFRQPDEAAVAWAATVEWFATYLPAGSDTMRTPSEGGSAP